MLTKLKALSFILFFISSYSLAATSRPATTPRQAEVVGYYSDLGYAIFSDTLQQAQVLQQAVTTSIAAPNPATQLAAQLAWHQARVPYSQSEAFRFENMIVDGWEGQVNAWPLDEGFIDYVDRQYSAELGTIPINLIAYSVIEMGLATYRPAYYHAGTINQLKCA